MRLRTAVPLVFAGGAVGTGIRALLGLAVPESAWPWMLLGINAAGSLLLGIVVMWAARHPSPATERARLLLGTGVMGGFTSYSALSLLVAEGALRPGLAVESLQAAVGYGAVSAVLGLVGAGIGIAIGARLPGPGRARRDAPLTAEEGG